MVSNLWISLLVQWNCRLLLFIQHIQIHIDIHNSISSIQVIISNNLLLFIYIPTTKKNCLFNGKHWRVCKNNFELRNVSFFLLIFGLQYSQILFVNQINDFCFGKINGFYTSIMKSKVIWNRPEMPRKNKFN